MRISSSAFSPGFWTKISCAAIFDATFLGAAFFCAGLAQAQSDPQSDVTFRASTELVVVDVLAEHKKTGLAVRGLTRDDFEVYEDKARQQITQFSLDTVPLSIVFLFDMTDSVRPVLKPLADGALAALEHLKPEDEIAVMLYAARADLTQDFTTDHALVARAIESASTMRPGHCASSDEPGPPLDKRELCSQEAYFNEGVFQATRHANKAGNASNRRVIIWLTDNVPNVPDNKVHSEAVTFDLLHESGVVVCSLLERSTMSYGMMTAYSRNPLFEP